MDNENLNYNLDIEKGSLWLRTTPGSFAFQQPYFCSEAGVFYAREGFSTSRSNKESYILFYTLEGCGLIEQGSSTIQLKKGEAVLMNCRSPQKYRTYGQKWYHYWMHIDGAGISSLENILLSSGKLTPVKLPASSAKSCFDPILRNLENPETETILQDSFLIHQLLYLIIQESNVTMALSDTNRQRILKTADYLQSHYQEKMNLEQLLKIVNMSKSYYLNLFRQYIGTTPYNYLLSLRITKAKELLELSNLPIREISDNVGFSDNTGFSVRFKTMVGQSPQEYRKNAITHSQ